MCGANGYNLRALTSGDVGASGPDLPSDGLGLRQPCCSYRLPVGWTGNPELAEVVLSICEDGFRIQRNGVDLVHVKRTSCCSFSTVEYSLTLNSGAVGVVKRLFCGPFRFDGARQPFAVTFPTEASGEIKALTVLGIVTLDLEYARREREHAAKDGPGAD
jgi:hypothetical protein